MRALGATGMLAATIHGVDKLAKMDGSEIKCSNDGNSFTMNTLSGGVKTELYYTSGNSLHFSRGPVIPIVKGQMATSLKTQYNLNDQQAAALEEGMRNEILSVRASCQKNPGKTFQIASKSASIPSTGAKQAR